MLLWNASLSVFCTCVTYIVPAPVWQQCYSKGRVCWLLVYIYSSTLHSRLILYCGVTALYCYSVTVVQCKSVTTVLQGKPVGLHAQVILCCGAKGQTFVIEAHFKCPEFKFVLYGKYSMKRNIKYSILSLFFLPHRSKEGRSDGETLTFLSKASNCQLVQHWTCELKWKFVPQI